MDHQGRAQALAGAIDGRRGTGGSAAQDQHIEVPGHRSDRGSGFMTKAGPRAFQEAPPASTVEVKVAPAKTQFSAMDKARVAREVEAFKAILATPGKVRLWQAPFHKPGGGIVTCGFGTTRRFNGAVQSVHKGLDFRAATGTPVHASGPGTVRLAKDVFFGGNLVSLDHGFGLFTVYAHMSRLDVRPGQVVQTGHLMGRSGATGRESAPHLHWGTSIDGVDVDPFLMQKAMVASGKIITPNATPGRRQATVKPSRSL
jgi:murein DD-endopeptidase MepM/ murein hydrolase activator NlpD